MAQQESTQSTRQQTDLGMDPLEQLARLTERFEELWYGAGGSPSTTGHLGPYLEDIQGRRRALGMEPYQPPTCRPGIGVGFQTLPPPPPLVRVNAFADALGRTPSATTSEEAELMDRLRTLRSQLQTRQDEVYSQDARSHDEMAMHDAEWEELDRKIDAIEQVLSAFNIIYRTR